MTSVWGLDSILETLCSRLTQKSWIKTILLLKCSPTNLVQKIVKMIFGHKTNRPKKNLVKKLMVKKKFQVKNIWLIIFGSKILLKRCLSKNNFVKKMFVKKTILSKKFWVRKIYFWLKHKIWIKYKIWQKTTFWVKKILG